MPSDKTAKQRLRNKTTALRASNFNQAHRFINKISLQRERFQMVMPRSCYLRCLAL